MDRRRRSFGLAHAHRGALALICAVGAHGALAQDDAAESRMSAPALKQAFDAAWSRQPEAVALGLRRDAAQAQQKAAQAWTPEPPALTVSNKTDRFNRDLGARELDVGVAIPLWLPGERARSGALAEAELWSVESRARAAQLRLAGTLREAWWQWQRAQVDAELARDQRDNASRLAGDVARRVKAGDLARADQHQADGAVAAAESAAARAQASLSNASQQLRVALGGAIQLASGAPTAAPEAEPPDDAASIPDPSAHPAFQDLQDRATIAERAAALGTVRARANPELTLVATRERDFRAERYDPSITLGVRIPFGAGSRHDARVAAAQAEATELQTQLALERDRIAATQGASRERVASARAMLAAAQRRAQLASESRGFFEKSFRLGETDLPTRLRIEAEAVEAQRQAASARIELAAAISQWRQALGLLPD
ncbi:TolC family protein [Variovorax humicola]|uniref:TolC family protein n=1 Tax=Variovorax humicola TaxID=1769758 RepID=A0ABU8VYK6_9BURK